MLTLLYIMRSRMATVALKKVDRMRLLNSLTKVSDKNGLMTVVSIVIGSLWKDILERDAGLWGGQNGGTSIEHLQ